MTGDQVVGLLLETFTIVGFAAAAVLFVVAMSLRAADRRWVETTAVILPDAGLPTASARWMSERGELHSRELEPHEHAEFGGEEAVTVYYEGRFPERIRFHRGDHALRLVLALLAVSVAIGVGSAVGSVAHTIVTG